MRGLLSEAPTPGAIRLLVGAHLMLIVQSILVLRTAVAVPTMLKLIVMATCLLALVAFALAVLGEPRADGRDARARWRRRHGH